MNMKISPIALVTTAALLLGGCMVGPDYHRVQVPVPARFKPLPGWTLATPSAEAPKGDWWTVFNDPLINQLEPSVSVSNQTVRQDYANYQAALADVETARSSLFPTLGVSSSTTRQRTAGSTGAVTNSGALEGSASWSIDLWGEVRRTVEENKATAQASEATLANATLSEQTALATAIIELRTSDANIALLQKNRSVLPGVPAGTDQSGRHRHRHALGRDHRQNPAGKRPIQPYRPWRGPRPVRACHRGPGGQKSGRPHR
ncbi:TolC family protein [Acerihabitans sp. KWT182]|uniref:TolC family protein n=1 Tax=Acerihabitans sp. KWT182 TaxID=3157919 RepID=A0AAU7QFL6_9GAMM